jgi:hypothetical protein
MSGPTFEAASLPGLYWLAEPVLPEGYGIALVTADPATAASTIDLAESWTARPGLYLMTGSRPAAGQGEAAFSRSARTVWSWYGPDARFAWVPAGGGEPGEWSAQVVRVTQAAGAASGSLPAPARLAFGQYAVVLDAGTVVELAADGFALSAGGFSFEAAEASWPLTASGTTISFADASAGCLGFSLVLPPPGGGGDDYERLDVGMRMTVDSARPDLRRVGMLRSLRYPVFDGVPAAGVSFACGFDPAAPAAAARSRLAFTGSQSHGSLYRGPLGHPVALTPQPGGGDPLPAGLAFHRQPSSAAPGADQLYLAPIGRYALGLAGGDPRLACGPSGYENFTAPSAGGAAVVYEAGGAAYAGGLVGGEATAVTLTETATCPYATVAAVDGNAPLVYRAQPPRGALHGLREATAPANLQPFLVYLEVPAGKAGESPPGAYPLLPYAGARGDLDLRTELEARVLAPRRRVALARLPPPQAEPSGTSDPVTGVTPPGILAGFDANLTSWRSVQLAAAEPQSSGDWPPPLELHSVTGELRNAFLSEQLFLVLADPALLNPVADFNYRITGAALRALNDLPQQFRPEQAVLQALAQNEGLQARGRAEFVAALEPLLPAAWKQRERAILAYCAYFELDIEGWRFALAPSLWTGNPEDPAPDAEAPVLMVVKFARSRLRDLVADPGAWTWPDAGKLGGSAEATAKALAAIVEGADRQVREAPAGRPSPYQFFVERVLDDASWNGVLFLNPLVSLDDLPAELRGLAAGIKPEKFRAHHLGASIGPAEFDAAQRSLTLTPTPLFGLIDYEDLEDIQQAEGEFDFKVLVLRVLFERSAIADFSSRIELFVDRLFGDRVTLVGSEHYNNLLLEGSYQRTRGGGHYVFATAHADRFLSASPILESIEVDSAQFNTLSAEEEVRARFTLWGKLRFQLLEAFDLFSFGPGRPAPGEEVLDGWLSYSGLALEMSFPFASPQQRRFEVGVEATAFDAAASRPRDESLFRRFPLEVSGMVRAEPGKRPRDMGFLAMHTPLPQPALDQGWHGLLFTVDLGSLGALAAEAGLSATLLAAWGGAASGPAVNAALKLPGVDSPGQLLPLEGILDMGFGALDLSASPAPGGGPAYALRMQRFYLRLLGWQFPPGQADITLFGDPDVAGQPLGGRRGPLGWYAAYKGPERKE